jgi:CheY-like chemotaxis protein
LLGFHLPDISGDEALRILRDDRLTKRIPVVVISADGGLARDTRVLAAGASASLAKPYDVSDLMQIINENLSVAPG